MSTMASLFLQLVLAALLVGDGWATPVTDAKSKYGITCSKTSSCRNYAVSGFKANALAQLNDILVNQTTNFPDVRFGSDGRTSWHRLQLIGRTDCLCADPAINS